MVLALRCINCSGTRLIDHLEKKDVIEKCQFCNARMVMVMKSYDWKSLQDVDMDIVRSDEENFDHGTDKFSEESDEEDLNEENDDEEERGNGADSMNAPSATCIEIKAMRTYQGLDNLGCVVEVCASKDGKDVYVYYEKDENGSMFRVCDKSYLEYMEYNEDDEIFPIHVFKEIQNEVRKEDKEFFPLFDLVMDLGEKITQGIVLPELYE